MKLRSRSDGRSGGRRSGGSHTDCSGFGDQSVRRGLDTIQRGLIGGAQRPRRILEVGDENIQGGDTRNDGIEGTADGGEVGLLFCSPIGNSRHKFLLVLDDLVEFTIVQPIVNVDVDVFHGFSIA